jgi:tRNA threonylcarbamoyladenosine biosynthesis protein TsaB
MLLAIDTATRIAGIALYDAAGLQGEMLWRTGDNHTTELLPLIVHLCQQAGLPTESLQAVGVSLGPGSFTGLRVGLSVGKGLALSLDIPIIGIPTLGATAYPHKNQGLPICALLPAGRGRHCAATYRTDDGVWALQGEYRLVATPDVPALITEPTLVCGEVNRDLAALLTSDTNGHAIVASHATALRRAGCMAEMAYLRWQAGDCDDLVSLRPIYLKTP